MCTAISYLSCSHFFGRNLDLEYHYNESVTVTPRNFPFVFRKLSKIEKHFAMIGVATISDGYPLYYDATNEHGLSMAGLNFPGNTVYYECKSDKDNVTPFEFIPWVLCQCKTVSDTRNLISRLNLVKIPFSESLPLTPLHWMISDRHESIVIETTVSGIQVYDNPVGVLTNNPPFDFHMHHLSNYLNLTREEPINRFTNKIDLTPYSRGMGAIGLPGDLSSSPRFIKVAFTKLNSVSDGSSEDNISQFFHILRSVEQQRGCVIANGEYEKTVYSSCCDTEKGVYYYTTYENSCITAVDMYNEDLDKSELKSYPLIRKLQINKQN